MAVRQGFWLLTSSGRLHHGRAKSETGCEKSGCNQGSRQGCRQTESRQGSAQKSGGEKSDDRCRKTEKHQNPGSEKSSSTCRRQENSGAKNPHPPTPPQRKLRRSSLPKNAIAWCKPRPTLLRSVTGLAAARP